MHARSTGSLWEPRLQPRLRSFPCAWGWPPWRCHRHAVAQTGLLAFVVWPPAPVRSIVRVTHERHIVLSSLMGAVLLMAADILARWLLAPQELPVGVLTAALGGTYLLWLMHRRTSQGGAL